MQVSTDNKNSDDIRTICNDVVDIMSPNTLSAYLSGACSYRPLYRWVRMRRL